LQGFGNLSYALLQDLMYLSVTQESLDNSFNQLVETLSNVIENNAPLQTASRRQKRILPKQWLTKGFLISIKNKQKMYKIGNKFEKAFYKQYSNKLTRFKKLLK